MYGQRPITTLRLWSAKTISKNAAATSGAIDLRQIAQNGPFSLHYILAGTGTVKITYSVCSTVDGTYLTPSTANDITASAVGAGSDFLSFQPELAPFMKIVVTEQNVNPITSLDLWLNVQ